MRDVMRKPLKRPLMTGEITLDHDCTILALVQKLNTTMYDKIYDYIIKRVNTK